MAAPSLNVEKILIGAKISTCVFLHGYLADCSEIDLNYFNLRFKENVQTIKDIEVSNNNRFRFTSLIKLFAKAYRLQRLKCEYKDPKHSFKDVKLTSPQIQLDLDVLSINTDAIWLLRYLQQSKVNEGNG